MRTNLFSLKLTTNHHKNCAEHSHQATGRA